MNQLKLDHPSAPELAAFALGRLDEDLAVAVESHLAVCETCRGAVDAAPTDSFVAKVQGAFPPTRHGQQASLGGDSVRTQTLPPRQVATDIPAELTSHPRYRLIELLGAGGMGAVFKAEHLLMKRTVAVKVINRSLFGGPAVTGRFAREMEAVAKLTHPNIVHAYDAEEIGATHFLAMEYVEGVSLAKLLTQRGPLPVAEACSYIRQAALGLQHADERGMVHRDIKPQNLMVTSDGQVKILDFGLARFVLETAPAGALLVPTDADAAVAGAESNTPVEPLTQVGTVMGTPAYIAPEQARDPHTADIRADIYSLGCTLYDLLTGRPPFPEGTARQKVIGHLCEPPRPLVELRPDVPRALALVVDRMLAKDPAQRFQTPAEVAAALRPWAQDAAPEEARSLPAQRSRRRMRLGLAAAVVVAVLGVLGYLWLPPLDDFAQTVVRVATNKGVLVIEAEDQDLEISIKRDGTEKTVIARVSKGNKEVIELRAGDLTIDASLPGGDRLKTTELTLARGGRTLLTARLLLTPQVLVSRPVERKVTDYEEFNGRINAAEAVHIRPRLSGLLQEATFREGDLVRQGQVLFVIDPRPTENVLDQARARAKKVEAQLTEKTARSKQAILAELSFINAEVERLKLALEFTKVTAPIGGRIGRLYVTKGNLVIADETMLSTIFTEDPMYVYFDMEQATLLRIRRAVKGGQVKPAAGGGLKVVMGLAGEEGFPHEGSVNFVDNTVNPVTGTIANRAGFANPLLASGHRLLTPGMSVRLRLPVGEAHRALLIKYPGPPAQSGAPPQDFVYLVDDQNQVVRRTVKWGQQHDGLIVVREGLQPGDRVIVGWTEVPRPGDTVQAKLVGMPGN